MITFAIITMRIINGVISLTIMIESLIFYYLEIQYIWYRNTRLIRNRSKILQEIFDMKRLYRKEKQDLQDWLGDTERPVENYLFG